MATGTTAAARLKFPPAPRAAIRATSPAMETKPPIPLAVLVGIQTPDVDDVAHEASLEELGRLVKTLG